MTYTTWLESNPLLIWIKEKNIPQIRAANMIGVKRQTIYYWLSSGMTPNDDHMATMEQMTGIVDFKKQWVRWQNSCPKELDG